MRARVFVCIFVGAAARAFMLFLNIDCFTPRYSMRKIAGLEKVGFKRGQNNVIYCYV